MNRFDRLATLMDRFSLDVEHASLEKANLVVTATSDGVPDQMLFFIKPLENKIAATAVLFSAHVEWGGHSNPVLAALPAMIEFDLINNRDNAELVLLMQSEFAAQRCGVDSVVNRLAEVLIIRMLRAQIEAGSTQTGLLAGLSDPRISRAIVAIHERPGHNWKNEELALIAGMSLSRFAEVFPAKVGEPPAAYLRSWRLILARQDVAKGDRVDAIARRYGYVSPEGFTRAFRKHFGENPMALRRKSMV